MNFAHDLDRFGPDRAWAGSHAEASDYCRRLARSHYENFTVASRFVPRPLRTPTAIVYAWCRWADHLADETGDAAPGYLDWWQAELDRCYAGRPAHPVTAALAQLLPTYRFPRPLFDRLLAAFRHDQAVKTYATFDELLWYCDRSANPVGELVLYLYGCHHADLIPDSDAICTGLQLANFWQDVRRDREIGRVYLPQADLARFGVTPADLRATLAGETVRQLVKFQVDRTQGFFDRGAALLPALPRPARRVVTLFHGGGTATLEAIRHAKYDVLTARPTVSKRTKLGLALRLLVG